MSFNWFCLKSAFVWLYYYAVHLIFANFAWNLRHFQLVLMQRVFHYITPRVKGFVKMDFVKMSLYNKWIIAYEHYFEGSGDILLHVRVGVYEYWQAWCRGQTNEILSQRSVRDQRLLFIISNPTLQFSGYIGRHDLQCVFVEFRAKVLIAAAWILSFVFALPILVLFDVTDDNVTYLDKTVTLCDPDFNHIHGPKVKVIFTKLRTFLHQHKLQIFDAGLKRYGHKLRIHSKRCTDLVDFTEPWLINNDVDRSTSRQSRSS